MFKIKSHGRKLSAILGFVLLVTLLVTLVLTVSMSASTDAGSDAEYGFSIGPKNIELGDDLRIGYQVINNTENTDLQVKMYFWNEAPEDFTTAKPDYIAQPLSDEQAAEIGVPAGRLVFFSAGIPQTDMAETVYCMVYAKDADGTVYTSAPCKYSILNYVYQRRAEHLGGIKTATEDQLALYSATLRAGGAAQKYLDRNTGRLANANYANVTVSGTTFADGFSSALLCGGETISLTAPDANAAGESFSKWVINYGDGEVVIGNTAELEYELEKITVGYPNAVPEVSVYPVYGNVEFEEGAITTAPTVISGVEVFATEAGQISAVKLPSSLATRENEVGLFIDHSSLTLPTDSAAVLMVNVPDNTVDADISNDVFVYQSRIYVDDYNSNGTNSASSVVISLGTAYELQIQLVESDNSKTMLVWDVNFEGGRNFLGKVTNLNGAESLTALDLRVEFYNNEQQLAKVYINDELFVSENSYYVHNGSNVSTFKQIKISPARLAQNIYIADFGAYVCDGEGIDLEGKDVIEASLEPTTFADRWVVAENTLNEKSLAALQSLYNFYDDPAVDNDQAWNWLVNLWDAEIGGFYYAESGKNSEGYLPDTEATSQALGVLQGVGMFSTVGNDTVKALDYISDYINNYARDNGIELDEVNLRNQISSFAYSRFASDGYFRHPQWSFQINDTSARIGRDLSNATGLTGYGSKVVDVVVLDSAAAVSYMMKGSTFVTVPLGASYSTEVLAVADAEAETAEIDNIAALEEYILANYETLGTEAKSSVKLALESVDEFIKYLNKATGSMSTALPGEEGYIHSHNTGHGLSSSSKIVDAAADREITCEGTESGKLTVSMREVRVAYMNIWQYKIACKALESGREITGLWEVEIGADEADIIGNDYRYYTELSGLYKIGSSYGSDYTFKNTLISSFFETEEEYQAYAEKFGLHEGFAKDADGNRVGYGYIDAMIDRAIDGILADVPLGQFVHIYNPWLGLNTVLTKMRTINSETLEKEGYEVFDMEEVISYIRGESDIVDGQNRTERMLSVTVEKLELYRCHDGSFSYHQTHSDPATQGTPVGLGMKEGDVNATALGLNGLRGAICSSLGFNRVNLFDGKADFDKLVKEFAKKTLANAGVFVDDAELGEYTLDAKKPVEYELDFSYDQLYNYVTGTGVLENGTLRLPDDNASGGASILFKHNAYLNSGTKVQIDNDNLNLVTFGAKAYIDWESTAAAGFQLTLGGDIASTKMYMLTIDQNANGQIVINDAKSGSALGTNGFASSIVIDDGQWFDFDIEYRIVNGQANITVTVVEADGTTHTRTSTNSYGGANCNTIKNAVMYLYSRDANVTDIILDDVRYSIASAPRVAGVDGVTVSGNYTAETDANGHVIYTGMSYGESVTLTAPAFDENGAAFLYFKRNTGILSKYQDNITAQTEGLATGVATLDNLPEWFENTGAKLGKGTLVGDNYTLTVATPAGDTTYTAVYDTACEVEFVGVVDNNANAPQDGRYPAGEFNVSAPLKNADGQPFAYWRYNDGTSEKVINSATCSVVLPVGGKVQFTAVYEAKEAVNGEFTGKYSASGNQVITPNSTDDVVGDREGVVKLDATGAVVATKGASITPTFATDMTLAEVKVLSFDMYMPRLGDKSMFTDYYNESTDFTAFYQISVNAGGNTVAYMQVGSESTGVLDGYYLSITNSGSIFASDEFDDTTLSFDTWYTVSLEMVFSADENGAYTVPTAINVYVNNRFVGTTDIFYCKNADATPATEYYKDCGDGDLTMSVFAVKRNKAIAYFDDIEYYEN